MKRRLVTITIAIVAGLMLASCSKKVELTGAGATFPEPYYTMIFKNYHEETGVNVSYGGVGSGGGVRSLKDEVVDFCGTDVIPDAEEAEGMKPVVYIPTCRGAVVLSYNIPGVTRLNLNASVITAIYLGDIVKWNDARLQAINSDVTLPDLAITPVYRSDGSGTTFNFSAFMNDADSTWQSRLGKGKSLSFAVGVASKGNPGVAGSVANTSGAIGYIGSEYAFSMNIPVASILNAAGQYAEPTSQAIMEGSYPICCTTWIGIYKEQNYAGRSLLQAQSVLDLMHYMLRPEVQSLAESLHYAALSEDVRQEALKSLEQVTYNGEPVAAK